MWFFCHVRNSGLTWDWIFFKITRAYVKNMKLRLPSLLLTAILATFTSLTASADVIGNGVVYDVGKTAFSADNIPNKELDANFCWAAGAANTLQYWQDTYGEALADKWDETPNGVNTTEVYSNPTGTKYLNIYRDAYSEAKEIKSQGKFSTGFPNEFTEWYAKGTNIDGLNPNTGGYYTQLFDGKDASAKYDMEVHYPGGPGGIYGVFWWTDADPTPDMHAATEGDYSLQKQWENISAFIMESFETQGQAVTLCINEGHIVNCWGYEANAEGLVTSLILTNMDDSTFGAFRVDVEIGMSTTEAVDNRESTGVIDYSSFGERLILQTDDENCLSLHTFGGDPLKAWISSAYRVATPEDDAVTINGESVNLAELRTLQAPNATIEPGETLVENTRLVNDVNVAGNGITVGDGKTAVLLVSAADETLTLTGQTTPGGDRAQTDGMHVSDGGMVSLRNLNISGYAQDGIQNDAKTYLHDGTINISENGGYGIKNTAGTSYVEIKDNDTVTISSNDGGGIYNGENATTSIRGNDTVVFAYNASGEGNDIYNAKGASLNIADNGSVIFSGMHYTNTAVVNEGEMYVKSGQEPTGVEFRDSSLDSSQGTTYLGRDINGNTSATTVAFTENDWESELARLEITGGKDGIAAELEHLTVNAHSIMGAGDSGGVVSNALINSLGGMTMSKLQLDTTDSVNSLGSGFTNLDNVVLTLTNDDMAGNTFDLTNVLTGNLTLNNVVFDLSSTTLTGDALKDITFNLSKAYAEEQKRDISFKTATTTYTLAEAGSTVLFAATPLPEPTTGTLSLLALAGLAARRRRK